MIIKPTVHDLMLKAQNIIQRNGEARIKTM